MGACYHISRAKIIIKANISENKNIIDNSDTTSIISQISMNSKDKNKLNSSRSNLSSNSTCAQIIPTSNPYRFSLPATIGEIEIPISVERNEIIIIKFNSNNNKEINDINNTWTFLPNEPPVNFLGYPNYKFNNANIGSLHLRITGDNKIYHLNKIENHITANDKGNLLFFANLNTNYYSIYEPKGSLSILVYGGSYSINNDLYISNNINSFSNNNKINLEDKKEYQILYYINKARINLKKFFHNYFSNNEEINLEFKDFVINYNKSKELIMNNDLIILAKKHCEDLYENETSGNIGTDGCEIKEKIKKFNKNCKYCGINIIYNINNPLLIVKNMMIDKYSKKKKNRKNLFFEKYNKIGIFLKEHPIYKYCCVIIFSE